MEQKRELIIDAATRLFRTYGYNSVTMDDIAQEVGMSKKTIYQIFENKTDLVDCSVEKTMLEIRNTLPILVGQSENPLSAFFLIYNYIFSFSPDNSPMVHRSLRKYYPACYSRIENDVLGLLRELTTVLIQEGIEKGLFIDESNADDFFLLLSNQLFSLMNGWLISYETSQIQRLPRKSVYYALRAISTSEGIHFLSKLNDQPENHS